MAWDSREEIEWHPIVDDDACIGCGTCIIGCSRKVYRFDLAWFGHRSVSDLRRLLWHLT